MESYGTVPTSLGEFIVEDTEQFRYQYLPIKFPGSHGITVEDRLSIPFGKMIGAACCDYIGIRGIDSYVDSYVYITAKRLFQIPCCPITRIGWHTDGFMTDDINYFWCDALPTIFNNSIFDLSQDDRLSIHQMNWQAKVENNFTYNENTLLRLDQYVVHKASETPYTGVRTIVKISFSKDKYDLLGNSHNYLLKYNWVMRPRQDFRNIPQFLG